MDVPAQPNTSITWFGMIVILVVLFAVARGLANPRARPFLLSLIAIVVVGAGFLALSWTRTPTAFDPPPPTVASDARATRVIEPPSPPKNSASVGRPKLAILLALGDAALTALTHGAAATATPAAPGPAPIRHADARAVPQPPAWVNASPKIEDGRYEVSKHAGPYTTVLECAGEVPKIVQNAVAEYAELSLGPQAAGVRLPDSALEELVQARWTETRQMDLGETSQEMFTLHALIVFDAATQKRIKVEAQRIVINKRVQGAAVVLGGVLGLLALAWAGLRHTARRPAGAQGVT